MSLADFKTWVEIISSLLTASGVLIAAIVALFRWGPGAGPRLLIRQFIFIPPGSQKEIKSNEIVIAADVIFANPASTTEYITDVSLILINPEGGSCKYSPFIFAEPDAFFDKDQTPKWVQSLFHPLMIQGSGKEEQITETYKNLVFFNDKDNHLLVRPGRYKIRFVIERYSLLPWRRKTTNEMSFEMEDSMVADLTSKDKPQKVALLDWHFK